MKVNRKGYTGLDSGLPEAQNAKNRLLHTTGPDSVQVSVQFEPFQYAYTTSRYDPMI